MTTYQKVEVAAKTAGFLSYEDYLLSDHWKALKKQANIHGSLCCVCQSGGRVLGHHIRYRNLLDVQPSDLVPMCRDCHDVFHMACRRDNISYIDLEIPRIAAITTAFLSSDFYARWKARKEQKSPRREKQSNPSVSNKRFKSIIRKQFRHFLRGSITADKARAFCAWLTIEVSSRFPAQLPEVKSLVIQTALHPGISQIAPSQPPPEQEPIQEGAPVVLTKKLIHQCRTSKGGFTKITVNALGVSHPLKSGWLSQLVGKSVTSQAYAIALHGKWISKRRSALADVSPKTASECFTVQP